MSSIVLHAKNLKGFSEHFLACINKHKVRWHEVAKELEEKVNVPGKDHACTR